VQLVLGSCRLVLNLLSGVGDHLVPFIITEMSLKNVDVRNWSSMVCDAVTIAIRLENMESWKCRNLTTVGGMNVRRNFCWQKLFIANFMYAAVPMFNGLLWAFSHHLSVSFAIY